MLYPTGSILYPTGSLLYLWNSLEVVDRNSYNRMCACTADDVTPRVKLYFSLCSVLVTVSLYSPCDLLERARYVTQPDSKVDWRLL